VPARPHKVGEPKLANNITVVARTHFGRSLEGSDLGLFRLAERRFTLTINLTLSAQSVEEETIQQLTRELCQTINQQTEFDASIGERASDVGTKGDAVTIGQIALAVLGAGGGAAALIGVFKSYVERSKELSIKLKKTNGEEIEVSSKNIDTDEIRSYLKDFLTTP
jgi:hypothetical protein